MKILIVSNSPLRNDNSFGNSFSNIFEGIPDIEIANIYCKYGKPQSNIGARFFQITEKSLLKNLIKGTPSGKEVYMEEETEKKLDDGEATFNKMRRHRTVPVFWARALIWKICRWKSKELKAFVDDFKPDLLFVPIYFSHYIHDINKFIKDRFNIPVLGYVSDDVYIMEHYKGSLLLWIDKMIMRSRMRKVFSWCKTIYVISETQKREYTEIFGDKFKILTKCADFADENRPAFKEPANVLKMVYAGNISIGRYEILAELAKVVENINKDGKKFELDIYTLTSLTEEQEKSLNSESVHLLPPVNYEKLREIQSNADILIHAESFHKQECLAVHQSFSTKIVDYLSTYRCILAIGDDYCSSIQYFIENECGAVAKSYEEIETRLRELDENRDLFKHYADKAWESGKCKHDKLKIKEMILTDLKNAVERNNEHTIVNR